MLKWIHLFCCKQTSRDKIQSSEKYKPVLSDTFMDYAWFQITYLLFIYYFTYHVNFHSSCVTATTLKLKRY